MRNGGESATGEGEPMTLPDVDDRRTLDHAGPQKQRGMSTAERLLIVCVGMLALAGLIVIAILIVHVFRQMLRTPAPY